MKVNQYNTRLIMLPYGKTHLKKTSTLLLKKHILVKIDGQNVISKTTLMLQKCHMINYVMETFLHQFKN